jgi:anti-sigma factor RsiW
MSSGRPIAEIDLHAYVDDALDVSRRAEVECYLVLHRQVGARIDRYEELQRILRAAFAPFAEEPIPPELNLAQRIATQRRSSRWSSWRAAAAAALLLAFGGAGGWSLDEMQHQPAVGVAALAREAAYNYEVYGPDKIHPVEFKAADSASFTQWFSQRLGSAVKPPDLTGSGYHLMGCRLIATPHGPAALFMYGNGHNGRGTRLVLLVKAMKIKKSMPMSPYAQGALNGFAWSDHGMGFSLVGATPSELLQPLANEVRNQMGPDV